MRAILATLDDHFTSLVKKVSSTGQKIEKKIPDQMYKICEMC